MDDYIFLFVCFACDYVAGVLVDQPFDFGKGALAELEPNLEIAELEYLLCILYVVLSLLLVKLRNDC